MNNPEFLIAGDALTWSEPFTSAMLSGSSFKVALALEGQVPTIVNGTLSGSEIVFSITSAISAAIKPGIYDIFLFETTAAGCRYSRGSGTMTVRPDPTSSTDNRSHVKKTLDLIETAIEDQASESLASKSVDGISLSFCDPAKLFELREKYAYLYACERNGGNPPLPQSATLTWRR